MRERPTRRFAGVALVALAGIGCIEVVNTVRVLSTRAAPRVFPQNFVSRGVYSAYGLVRPLDATSTDFGPSVRAAQSLLAGEADLYAGFDREGSSFIYPPSTALLFAPFGLVANVFGEPRAVQVMDAVGRLSVAGLVMIACVYLRGHLCGWRDWVAAVLVLLAFYPNRWALVCVQSQLLVNLSMGVGLVAYGLRRRTACGVLVGLASVVKPHFLVLSLFACARREWRVAIASVATVTVAAGVTLFVLGIEPWRTYLGEVVPAVANGYAMEANQSVLGLVRRWEGDDATFRLSDASAAARGIGLACSACFLLLAVAPRGRASVGVQSADDAESEGGWPGGAVLEPDALRRGLDFGVAVLAVTLASPIAWEHHFGWTIVLFSACYAGISGERKVALGALVVSYVLLGSSWLPVAREQPGVVSLINSLRLFAAVGLLVVVWKTSAGGGGTHESLRYSRSGETRSS